MSDLISREQAIEVADAIWVVTGDKNVAKVWQQLQDLPSAEKTGRWIEQSDEYNDAIYQCSVCGEEFVTIEGTPADNLWNYCPNCGARMENEDE